MIKDKSLKEYKGWQLPKELKINENIGTLKYKRSTKADWQKQKGKTNKNGFKKDNKLG